MFWPKRNQTDDYAKNVQSVLTPSYNELSSFLAQCHCLKSSAENMAYPPPCKVINMTMMLEKLTFNNINLVSFLCGLRKPHMEVKIFQKSPPGNDNPNFTFFHVLNSPIDVQVCILLYFVCEVHMGDVAKKCSELYTHDSPKTGSYQSFCSCCCKSRESCS